MLKINGRDYELKFDINVMCKMAGAGIDVMQDGIDRISSSLPNLRKAFFYGLTHENKKLTEAKAGDLMTEFLKAGNSISDVMEEVITALSFALGLEEDKEDENEVVKEEGK